MVALGLMGYGMVIIVWNVATVSYRQRTVPEATFSRANAAYRWITWGVFPVGSALAGALTSPLGMTSIFLLAGALPILVGLEPLVRRLRRGSHQSRPPFRVGQPGPTHHPPAARK